MPLVGIPSMMVSNTINANPPASPLLSKLISYWKLEEASGTRIDSVTANGNDLTDNNSTPNTTGKIGNAALFTTANSRFLSRTSNSSLQMPGNTSFTITAWVNPTTTPVGGWQIVTKDVDTPANSRDYTMDLSVGWRFYIKGGATYIADSAIVPTIGTWYFLVGWYDSSNGQVHMRVNDATTYDSVTGATGTDVSTAQFRIGARAYSGFEGYANAAIDEVGLWKRMLTAAEITRLYNGGNGLTYPFV